MYRGYPSLEQFKAGYVKKLDQQETDVIITEKIHGCNLAFILQLGRDIAVQSRNKVLEKGEKFYAYEHVVDKYRDILSGLCKALCKEKTDTVHVFGEMFGGHYPGQPKVDGVKLIQPRLFYCPGNDFAVFNILVNDRWLTYDETDNLCAAHGLPIVPCLARCKVSELGTELTKWAEFTTRVPIDLYKLPELKQNFAEGVVIRLVTSDGSLGRMFKFKNRKFSERAFKLTDAQKKERDTKQDTNRKQRALCQSYITEARIEAHLSKYGPEPRKDEIDVIAQDAFRDLGKEEGSVDGEGMEYVDFMRATTNKIDGLLKKARASLNSA